MVHSEKETPMLLKSALAIAILGLGLAAAQAAVHVPGDAPAATLRDTQVASFWAQPYPYGYRWRIKPCVRKVCSGRVRVLGDLIGPAFPRGDFAG
jgi:hypothetical protein